MSERAKFQGAKTSYSGKQLHNQEYGLFAKMREMLDRLEKDAGQVLDNHPRQSLNSYPTSSAADKQGSRGKSHHADPTYSVVVRILGGSPAGSVIERCFGHLHMAAKELEAADSLRAQAIPPKKQDPLDDPDNCRSCLRIGKCSPVAQKQNASLCRFCYEFQRAEKELPPPVLLQKHARGERIYDRDVELAKAGKL